MAQTRIFGILDLELSKHLAFSFSLVENLTAPGCTTLRPSDRFRLTVWVTNNSAIPLQRVEGTISPSGLAIFAPAHFDLPQLLPRRRSQIATIEGRVNGAAANRLVPFHQIGKVRVSISPDLSCWRFEQSTPLVYVKSSQPV